MRRALFLLFLLSAPALAGDLSGLLSDLSEAGDDYEARLTALVQDPALPDAALSALAADIDWQVRHQAAVALGWRHTPDLYSALASLPPVRTRAGLPRMTGEILADPAAAGALLDRYLHGGEDAATRAALIEALVYTGGDWSQAVAARLTLEGAVEVRVVMVEILEEGEAAWALPALISSLSDASPEVRAAAAAALGGRPDGAEGADALLGALSDADAPTRANAARSLGILKVSRAVDALLPLLADESAEVRLDALRAVSRVDPAAAAALPQLGALAQDPDPKVARLAAKIQGQ